MNNRKVLFITGALGGGGAERVIANLVNSFENKGVNTSVLTVFSDLVTYDIDKRCNIQHLKNLRIPVLNRIYTIIQLAIQINKNKPDVVISFTDQVNILTAFAYLLVRGNIKLIFSERNDPYVEPNSSLQRKIRDCSYKKANGIVYQTKGEMDYFQDIVSLNVPQTIIENPIKPGLPVYKTDFVSKTFIAAGRLYPQKNYKMMIDAFEKVVLLGYSDYKLQIYGNGVLKNELEQYVIKKHLESNVEFFNFSKDIHNIISKSAGYLLSSDYEGISNSMAEALAIGVPVVSTDYPSGGASMYIENGITGYLVKCGDVESFAKSIIDIIEDRPGAIRMGKMAAERMKRLNVHNISEKWDNFIELVKNN